MKTLFLSSLFIISFLLFSCSEDQNDLSKESMTLEINKETVTSNTITVSWEPIRGAAYNVSINGEEMEKNVSMADKESFSFNNLSSNSHYNISVIAVNSKNRNSTLGEGALEVLTKENLDSFKNDLYAPLIKNKSDD